MKLFFLEKCNQILIEAAKKYLQKKSDKTIVFYLQLTVRLKDSLAKQT